MDVEGIRQTYHRMVLKFPGRHLSDLPQDGLKIPCVFDVWHYYHLKYCFMVISLDQWLPVCVMCHEEGTRVAISAFVLQNTCH